MFPPKITAFRLLKNLVNALSFSYTIPHKATSPSGKARVCKTLIVGSIPTVASAITPVQ
jgi:hypothetical protein